MAFIVKRDPNIPLSQANISLTGFSYTPQGNTNSPFNLIGVSITLPKQVGYDLQWYSAANVTGYEVLVYFTSGQWLILIYNNNLPQIETVATNPAPNTSIPATGWVLNAGAGNSGSVIITAA